VAGCAGVAVGGWCRAMFMALESKGRLHSANTRGNQPRDQGAAVLRGIDKYVPALRKIRHRSGEKADDRAVGGTTTVC